MTPSSDKAHHVDESLQTIVKCCLPDSVIMLEDITTEPHAHDISADILRVWLSGYILQHIKIVNSYILGL